MGQGEMVTVTYDTLIPPVTFFSPGLCSARIRRATNFLPEFFYFYPCASTHTAAVCSFNKTTISVLVGFLGGARWEPWGALYHAHTSYVVVLANCHHEQL